MAPARRPDSAESNWLPTVAGQKYDLMWRFYGPTKDLIDGKFYRRARAEVSADRFSIEEMSASNGVSRGRSPGRAGDSRRGRRVAPERATAAARRDVVATRSR